jgi:hypothetical protein
VMGNAQGKRHGKAASVLSAWLTVLICSFIAVLFFVIFGLAVNIREGGAIQQSR